MRARHIAQVDQNHNGDFEWLFQSSFAANSSFDYLQKCHIVSGQQKIPLQANHLVGIALEVIFYAPVPNSKLSCFAPKVCCSYN
jgi:hypothetical protein